MVELERMAASVSGIPYESKWTKPVLRSGQSKSSPTARERREVLGARSRDPPDPVCSGRFVDLAGLPAGDADLLNTRAPDATSGSASTRELWMHPDITGTSTPSGTAEFVPHPLDVEEPYRVLKDRSMHAARQLLRSLELPTLRDAVLASVVANLLDYGAPNLRESLSVGDFTNLGPPAAVERRFRGMVNALGRARRLGLADRRRRGSALRPGGARATARARIRRARRAVAARAAPC